MALFIAVALLLLDRSAAYIYRPGSDATDIIIFTTERCPYCKKLRAYLGGNKIPYTNYDIHTNPAGILGFWALRGRGVPVSTVGPDIIYGYDIKKIRESLMKLGYKENRLQHK